MGDIKNIVVDELYDELDKELNLLAADTLQKVNKIAQKYAQKLRKKTVATAPVRNSKKEYKHYRDMIATKCQKLERFAVSYLWYVKSPKYRLTHLLEYGHALHQGGRAEGTNFLSDAYKEIERDYIAEVEEVIRNG